MGRVASWGPGSEELRRGAKLRSLETRSRALSSALEELLDATVSSRTITGGQDRVIGHGRQRKGAPDCESESDYTGALLQGCASSGERGRMQMRTGVRK